MKIKIREIVVNEDLLHWDTIELTVKLPTKVVVKLQMITSPETGVKFVKDNFGRKPDRVIVRPKPEVIDNSGWEDGE